MSGPIPDTITVTLSTEQLPVLNDVLWEALNSATADDDEHNAYVTLQQVIQRQLREQLEETTR